MILSVGGYNGKSGEAKHTQQIKLYFYRKQIKSKFMEHFFCLLFRQYRVALSSRVHSGKRIKVGGVTRRCE